MNYCHRCESHYEKPGTCNCFAEKAAPVEVPYSPYLPIYPTYPTYPVGPTTPTWPGPGYSPWYTITWGGIGGSGLHYQ